MRGAKFFGIGAAFCVLALVLAVEAGFVSVAQAKGKPPKPSGTLYYGYAKFRDATGYAICSDGVGQYVDIHQGGEDEVEIILDEDDESIVKKMWAFLGSVRCRRRGKNTTCTISDRGVDFLLDIADYTWRCEEPKAVLDILLSHGTLEDDHVRFVVGYWVAPSVADYAYFAVDGIDQEAVNGDADDETYWTTENGYVRYYLGDLGNWNTPWLEPYPSSGAWKIDCQPSDGPVDLYERGGHSIWRPMTICRLSLPSHVIVWKEKEEHQALHRGTSPFPPSGER